MMKHWSKLQQFTGDFIPEYMRECQARAIHKTNLFIPVTVNVSLISFTLTQLMQVKVSKGMVPPWGKVTVVVCKPAVGNSG
jgi:hypothetical protein